MITQTHARAIPHPRPGWGLWAAWTLATTGGVTASLLTFATTPGTDITLSLLPRVVIIAMIISLAQWPILHHYLPTLSPRQWLGANVLGGIAGFFVGWTCVFITFLALLTIAEPGGHTHTVWDLITAAAGGAGTGAGLALAQWLALRPYLRGSARWIIAEAVAWAGAGAAIIIMENSLMPPSLMTTARFLFKTNRTFLTTFSQATGLSEPIVFVVLVGLVGGLLSGAITGLALTASIRARPTETA